MPASGKRWRHVIINTKCSWLHGDERGFRSRGHRLHSSGDYKCRPPESEHAGLRDHHARRSGDPVEIPVAARPLIGAAIVENLTGRGHRLLAVSVSKLHAHFVVELPDVVPAIKTVVGWAKQKSSAAVTDRLPGGVWSAGETYKPIDSAGHLRAAVKYVWDQRSQGAWVWSFRQAKRGPGVARGPTVASGTGAARSRGETLGPSTSERGGDIRTPTEGGSGRRRKQPGQRE